ncbi:MAG: hypothetical protein NC926_00245 [Candidatus Omnitrophica bacterium]|nr:hypothetical protein [Candidatus Omnitrophota bacterium]MCM8806380.1 hypothetical protein [Candidatus Omnitrophota bacterium]
MKIKIFAILIGFLAGLSVYSFIGYIFTKRLPVGKRYKIKMILFFFLFFVILVAYFF